MRVERVIRASGKTEYWLVDASNGWKFVKVIPFNPWTSASVTRYIRYTTF